MAFSETRFNTNKIIRGITGGPTFKTALVQTNGGREQRQSVWSMPLGMWEYTDRSILEDEAHYVRDHFYAMRGMHTGFRFKDWLDYEDDGNGIVNMTGVGNGTTTGQLCKKYTAGGFTSFKKISKPVSGTISIFVDGSAWGFSIDHTTGIISLGSVAATVTAAVPYSTTGADLTIVAHGFQSGDVINLGMPGGWNIFNGPRTISVINANTVRITGNATGCGTFTGTGTVTWFPQARNNVTWKGEYDHPVRFDNDDLQMEFEAAEVITPGVIGLKAFNLRGLKMVELRL